MSLFSLHVDFKTIVEISQVMCVFVFWYSYLFAILERQSSQDLKRRMAHAKTYGIRLLEAFFEN